LVVATAHATNTLAGAALDAPELLDVDVDQLVRATALIAVRGLGRIQSGALAEAEGKSPSLWKVCRLNVQIGRGNA
jgi:hypothetical protein